MLFTISGAVGAEMPIGVHPAKFCGVSVGENAEGKPFLKWTFQRQDGVSLVGFTDTCESQTPRPTNKLGRYAAGLAGKPPVEGLSVDEASHIGNNYLCVVQVNKKGKPSLETFTPMPA
jgi:hypothetical protein